MLDLYYGNLDTYYDEELENAVSLFQEKYNLFPYGVLDLTTQIKLNDISSGTPVLIDKQLDAAIEFLNK